MVDSVGTDHGALEDYGAQLLSESSRLFVERENEISAKVITCTATEEHTITDEQQLDDYLATCSSTVATRIFLIRQQGSWGRLMLTASAAKKLLSLYKASTAFFDLLQAFGQKSSFEGDSYIHFASRSLPNSYAETTYIFKHVEEHGRPNTSERWSVRQMGVYSQTHASAGNTFIILNPSTPFQKHLKSIVDRRREPLPTDIHRAIFQSSVDRWRWYINDIESRYLDMKSKAQLTQVDEKRLPNTMGSVDIHFEDTQEIQVLQDKCLQAAHYLHSDHAVLRNMQNVFRLLPEGVVYQPNQELSPLYNLLIEVGLERKRIENIVERLNATVALIRTILDFECLASLRTNSRMMTEMTRMSQNESQAMLKLAEKTSRDTDIMKILTLLALIYLPASFVASMMGMDYIHVNVSGSRLSLHFECEFWIFLILYGILSVVTFGIYYSWTRSRQSNRAH